MLTKLDSAGAPYRGSTSKHLLQQGNITIQLSRVFLKVFARSKLGRIDKHASYGYIALLLCLRMLENLVAKCNSSCLHLGHVSNTGAAQCLKIASSRCSQL